MGDDKKGSKKKLSKSTKGSGKREGNDGKRRKATERDGWVRDEQVEQFTNQNQNLLWEEATGQRC